MLVKARFNVYAMATLSERIKEAIETSGVSVVAVAAACKISPQAVYGWMKGETKELMGENLVELAEITGFEARWIAKEIGPKHRVYARTPEQAHVLNAMTTMAPYEVTILRKIVDSVVASSGSRDQNGPKASC